MRQEGMRIAILSANRADRQALETVLAASKRSGGAVLRHPRLRRRSSLMSEMSAELAETGAGHAENRG